MKKTMQTILGIALVLAVLAACGPLTLTFPGETPKDVSRADEVVTRALEAFKAIGPFTEMKGTDRLTKTTKTDEATDTAIESYYDDDRLVYEHYLGYGEDTFTYYPDGGTYPCLFCQDEGDKRVLARYTAVIDGVWVQVETDGEMHRSDAYGAQQLTVYTVPNGDRLSSTVYSVNIKKSEARITSARYQKANGDWYTYRVEEGQSQEEPLWLKLTDDAPAHVGGDKALPAALAKEENVTLFLTLGEQQSFYFSEGGGRQTWYVEAPLTIRFADEKARNAFWRQHPEGTAEDTATGAFVWKSRALLQMTGADFADAGFADAIDLMTREFNDPVRYKILLGETGEIRAFRSADE